MDITPVFNEVLRAHDGPKIERRIFRVQDLDEFLKEAYRICAHIQELNTYLRSIRQSYLSTAQPPRNKRVSKPNGSVADKDTKYLTDNQRTEIDAQAKQLLRELNAAIGNLAALEQARQTVEQQIALKKRARQGLGALGRWAAGGAITAKSPEEEEQEKEKKGVKVHREGVICYLRKKLEECSRFQSEMMEIRLMREVERSKSVLYKARGTMPVEDEGANGGVDYRGMAADTKDGGDADAELQLSPEQLQLFAQENQDMLKHYEDTLDQVRTAERSLLEISELQTTLANNLSVQAAHIDQLVEDSHLTAENVGSGNKELKRATERKSTARMVFYGTSVFCLTLVLWDLFI